MPLTNYKPFWPETAILLGAGATASLGLPSSEQMGKTIHRLAVIKDKKNLKERINEAAYFYGIETELEYFLTALGDNLNYDGVSYTNEALEAAKKILPQDIQEEKVIERILEWKAHYDWNALRRLAVKVPVENNNYSFYIMDLYNMIDGSLLSRQGVQDTANETPVFLFPHRLQAARNLLVLLSNLMMACAYHKTRTENSQKFSLYLDFFKILSCFMQREAIDLKELNYYLRNFYLMSYSIISFNFEPVFLWFMIIMFTKLNETPPYIGKRNLPVRLFRDLAVVAATKDSDIQDEAYYSVNETVAKHINGIKESGRIFRICKFYYVHGSANIRECENCGKMLMLWGKWVEIPKDLFTLPPFKTNLFGVRAPHTIEEDEAYSEGRYDAVQCSFCGNMTYAYNNTMVMQSAYKGGHTSFLEEIQRDAKVSLSGAKHIILLGYSLPPDDVIWRSAIVAKQKNNAVYCSVVVGYMGEDRWLEGEELLRYVSNIKNNIEKEEWASWGINAIDAATAIFGKNNVRAYTGGIPQVWCSDGSSADKSKIEDLLYPIKVFPDGIAGMRLRDVVQA